MPRWRVVVHALDRTGPPMLARALLRWLRVHHPDHGIDVVAVRGGELLDDFLELAPVRVLLDPHEPWSWEDPDPARVAGLARRVAGLAPVDATLLVSVAAAAALPFLAPDVSGPIVTWAVEQGEDLHRGADDRTTHWLAGSSGTRDELEARFGPGTEVPLVVEFVERPEPLSAEVRDRYRTAMGAAVDQLLVVGAGIATVRKAPDLFLEVALAHRRRGSGSPTTFVWLGGERDPFFHAVRLEAVRLGLHDVRFFGDVVDVVPFLAAADVMLHPARLDSFPLVCLHAAGVGTPVVAFSGAGGVPEMMGQSFCGAAFPDVVGLADRIDELADERRRQALGATQQAAVTRRFVADVSAPAVLEQLLSAAGGASAGGASGEWLEPDAAREAVAVERP